MVGIGQRIKEARLRRGMTQPNLAEAIGRDNSTISRWEAAEMVMNVDDLVKIAEALGMSACWLLTGGEGLDLEYSDLVNWYDESDPESQRLILAVLRESHEMQSERRRVLMIAEERVKYQVSQE